MPNSYGQGWSTDYGANFTLRTLSQVTIGGLASADVAETYAYGGFVNGGLHRSLDSGATWTVNWKAWGGGHQYGVCDTLGKYIMATRTSTSGGTAQWSSDYGVTHSAHASLNKTWFHAMSRDGSFCVFANGTDRLLYVSSNSMGSWSTINFTSEMSSATYIRSRMHVGYGSGDTLYLSAYNLSDQIIYLYEPGDGSMTSHYAFGSAIGTGSGFWMSQFSLNKFGGKDMMFRTMNGNLYRIDDITSPSAPTLIWDGTVSTPAFNNSLFFGIY
jgi:hypothetical protein